MRQHDIVFGELLKQIRWARFDRLVDEHNADKDKRQIKCKTQLIAMLLGQLCGARGLREIEASLQSHAGRLYHLGGTPLSRSALSTSPRWSRPSTFR